MNLSTLTLVHYRGDEEVYLCPKQHTGGQKVTDTSGHLYHNKKKGVWFCFKCREGGRVENGSTNIIEITQTLLSPPKEETIIQLPTLPVTPISFRMAATKVKIALKDYLIPRHLHFKDVEPHGFQYYSIGEHSYGAIYIPYYEWKKEGDMQIKDLTYYVLRYIIGDTQIRYLNPYGMSTYPRLYLNTCRYDKTPLIIVEGVTDAIRLTKLGYQSVALGGKHLSPLQLRKLVTLQPSEYVILLDQDALLTATDCFNLLKSVTSIPVKLRVLQGAKDPATASDSVLKQALKEV